MHTLPVDLESVRVMVRLASCWDEQEMFENALVENGWAHRWSNGELNFEWGGVDKPHWFIPHSPKLYHDPPVWRLELDYPPQPGQESYVQLLCALKWPSYGRDPEPGEEYDDEDCYFDDPWTTQLDVTHADWDGEFDRLAALVRQELGDPVRTIPAGEDRSRLQAWNMGAMAVVLASGVDLGDAEDYHDGIFLRICPVTSSIAQKCWPE
ncbi:hypothetical protein [Nocardia sp. NBC_01009]|uniref:hypothetical protein n=1 Tax=Nocardia sp. NBC_01009 TaxID=2975996 RepID=UPI003863A030|nr:hypothetical protein OHA42_02925 [Nocardia sp. NBC_01009]